MGEGVAKDLKEAIYYYELAAMKVDNQSRCRLGFEKAKAGK
jgi:TPR repeat protein